MSAPALLTPREVATFCSLNYRTVLRAIEAGELPASRVRNRLRIRQEDMDAWIDASRTTPRTAVLPDRSALRSRKSFERHSLKRLNEGVT